MGQISRKIRLPDENNFTSFDFDMTTCCIALQLINWLFPRESCKMVIIFQNNKQNEQMETGLSTSIREELGVCIPSGMPSEIYFYPWAVSFCVFIWSALLATIFWNFILQWGNSSNRRDDAENIDKNVLFSLAGENTKR